MDVSLKQQGKEERIKLLEIVGGEHDTLENREAVLKYQ